MLQGGVEDLKVGIGEMIFDGDTFWHFGGSDFAVDG